MTGETKGDQPPEDERTPENESWPKLSTRRILASKFDEQITSDFMIGYYKGRGLNTDRVRARLQELGVTDKKAMEQLDAIDRAINHLRGLTRSLIILFANADDKGFLEEVYRQTLAAGRKKDQTGKSSAEKHGDFLASDGVGDIFEKLNEEHDE